MMNRMPPTVAPKRIALYARSETRFLMTAIATEIKRRTGAVVILYCSNRQEVSFYESVNKDEVFAEIVDFDSPLQEALKCLPTGAALVARAAEWETRLDTTLNRLVITNRHYGRGYALGGYHHPRSRMSENSTYDDVLRHYCASLAYWSAEIEKRGFGLIINGNKEMALIARTRNIPYRVINGSRYQNFHNWAWDELYENGGVEPAYRALAGRDFDGADLPTPYDSHLQFRNWFVSQRNPLALIKRAVREVVKYAYWHLRGYQKARGYYLRENLKYFYRIWADSRRLSRMARSRLSDLAGRRFAFYPLHLEPETSLQGLSPEYFYQLSLIAAVSRDLPAGTILVVKEHMTAIGRRPRDFYGQIAEFKNVVLLDPTELGLECVKTADVTVTICGTAGFEAAVLGKQVVAFGHHNLYGFLPHVRVIIDEAQLAADLKSAFAQAEPTAQTRADGARFLAAIKASSFDLRGYSYRVLTNFDAQAVTDACDALERSLDGIAADTVP